jgi:hypothetical protein
MSGFPIKVFTEQEFVVDFVKNRPDITHPDDALVESWRSLFSFLRKQTDYVFSKPITQDVTITSDPDKAVLFEIWNRYLQGSCAISVEEKLNLKQISKATNQLSFILRSGEEFKECFTKYGVFATGVESVALNWSKVAVKKNWTVSARNRAESLTDFSPISDSLSSMNAMIIQDPYLFQVNNREHYLENILAILKSLQPKVSGVSFHLMLIANEPDTSNREWLLNELKLRLGAIGIQSCELSLVGLPKGQIHGRKIFFNYHWLSIDASLDIFGQNKRIRREYDVVFSLNSYINDQTNPTILLKSIKSLVGNSSSISGSGTCRLLNFS